VHQQMRAAILAEDLPWSREELDEIAQHINDGIRRYADERAEYERSSASRQAMRAVESRRLDGLDSKKFERVTKTQARSGEDADPAFVDAFEERLRTHRCSIVCMTVVCAQAPGFGRWAGLRTAILAEFVKNTSLAVSVLATAAQTFGWSEVAYADDVDEHIFAATAEVVIEGFAARGAGRGATRKQAKQRAAVALLAAKLGLPAPEFPEPMPAALIKPSIPIVDFAKLSKNPVAALHEWCQQTKNKLPVFEFTNPKGAAMFVCTAKAGGIEREGCARLKQNAKNIAAANLFGALSKRG
jgi:dsRNA-specific ribonuclease